MLSIRRWLIALMIRTLLLGLYFALAIILALPWLILWSVIVGSPDLMYRLSMKVVRAGNRFVGIRVRVEGLENIPAGGMKNPREHGRGGRLAMRASDDDRGASRQKIFLEQLRH